MKGYIFSIFTYIPNETFGILKDKMTRFDDVLDIKRVNAFHKVSKRDRDTCVSYVGELFKSETQMVCNTIP